jgi:hypothetical protein
MLALMQAIGRGSWGELQIPQVKVEFNFQLEPVENPVYCHIFSKYQ